VVNSGVVEMVNARGGFWFVPRNNNEIERRQLY